jgi:class 3 adenylate cyclase/tetratricopeptide (TPR) repeat protein
MAKFCDECGEPVEPNGERGRPKTAIEDERRQVTVLFSDLSGYTSMSERLDPEEVKEIMSRIFGKVTAVVNKYGGTIEMFVGDAAVAFFGVPKAREDDPVRAIRAAGEIHESVDLISPQFRDKVGKPLSMHSGINTGLVITGELGPDTGTLGVTGDTVNLASRLSGLAKPGEILVGMDTYRQSERYFTFESLERTLVKGKAEPVPIYKVLSKRERPIKIHRISGLKADFIGRSVELTRLREATVQLQEGKGAVFEICGDAGTGKSRLIEEFKAALDLRTIQWREGHTYAYSQNIPYFPLIDLLNQAWQIEETDGLEVVRKKIELGVERLTGKREDIVPYIGSLYSIKYSEIEGIDPEVWKLHLRKAVEAIFTAITRRGPTIIFFEDLHWADPSSIELLRSILTESLSPALFLCAYRPPFALFTGSQRSAMEGRSQEICLTDLSPSQIQEMVESLLKTRTIPTELRKFVLERAEGNPFYMEELINSLIESEILKREDSAWRLTRPIGRSDIPSTVQGVVSARLDRLEKETRRVLQESSVIGRTFLYEILTKVTELRARLSEYLHALEQIDLIRVRSSQPDLEYIFKHTLIQEIAYNGLLKKERQALHERIGLVTEEVFRDRLPEFYETLAFHFKQGLSVRKAVDYLVKSGEKCLHRYAVEESHQYLKEAFDILSGQPAKTKEEKDLLIDILLKWVFVFHYRGDFRGLTNLLTAHQGMAESVEDKARLGMLLGFSIGFENEKFRESYQYLSTALDLGEKIKDQQIIGYACAWLSTTCAEMGLLEEAVAHGERARQISEMFQSDQYMFLSAMSGLGQAYWHRGELKNAFTVAEALIDRGQKHSNMRCVARGHYTMGWGHFIGGDFPSATESFHRSIQTSADPYSSQLPRIGLIYTYVASGQSEEANAHLQELLTYTEKLGIDMLGTPAHALQGLVTIAKGDLGKGMNKFQETRQVWLGKERRCLYAASEYMLANFYSKIGQGDGTVRLPMIIKNIGFLLRNFPFAGKKAEMHFMNSINIAKAIGAKSTLGNSYLGLGLLYKERGKKDPARDYITKAIQVFDQCGIETYLRKAKEALASLG